MTKFLSGFVLGMIVSTITAEVYFRKHNQKVTERLIQIEEYHLDFKERLTYLCSQGKLEEMLCLNITP
jgi:hypothetical protein